MNVSRTFYAALSPHLWTIYNESALEPRLYKDPHTNNFMSFTPSAKGLDRLLLNKNCRHIRFLELVQDEVPAFMFQQPTMFDFKDCTKLQELRLSTFIDPSWADQLVRANPSLRVLEWAYLEPYTFSQRRSPNHSTNLRGSDDLEYLFTLRKLQSLKLEGWAMSPLHLCQVLYLNADSLEELHLASPCVVQDQGPSTDATWLVQKHLDTGAAGEMQQMSGKPLSLPKVKILHLGLSWEYTTSDSIYGLVKSMPALEQLYIELDQHVDMHQLARNLKASCPRLHPIRANRKEFKNETPVNRLKIVALGGACAPEHLVDFKIGLSMLDMFTTGTLFWHKDLLANLDLTLYGQGDQGETIGGLRNLLGQCRGLRRVSVTWIGRNLDRVQGFRSC
ncbi:MAG: hypothetical protein J3R72DRAFT_422786 [Linnemannia gamsii]|nr:MAG: hypothetical protein J3R72DRAFT_422786 [Linnemannia gamsii]